MSIASRITSIEGHISDIYDSVELTGVDTTDIDKNLVNVPNTLKEGYIDIINNGTDTLYNNFPKVSGEGTSLTLYNTYQAPMRNNLKGNTSQTGTPTPTSPIPVNVVSGNNQIEIYRKNRFTFNNLTDNTQIGVTVTYNNSELKLNGTSSSGGSIINNGTSLGITLPKGSYTFSIKEASGSFTKTSSQDIALFLRDVNNNNIANTSLGAIDYLSSKTFTKQFTLTQATDLYFYIFCNASGIVFNNLVFQVQVEDGSTASTYEPYNGDTYNIDLPSGMELCKIGNYQDYFYKDSDKWYLHKEIGKVVLNGSESGWVKANTTNVDRFLLNTSLYLNNSDSKCNLFKKGGIVNDVGIWFNNVNVQLGFNYSTYGTTTLEQWKTFLSNNNLILYQPLSTPTNTEITDTTLINQLEEIYIAKSKENQTNISQINNDLGFIISASALKKG